MDAKRRPEFGLWPRSGRLDDVSHVGKFKIMRDTKRDIWECVILRGIDDILEIL